MNYFQVHEVFEFRTLLVFQDKALKANKVEEHQLTTASFLFHHSAVYVKGIYLKYTGLTLFHSLAIFFGENTSPLNWLKNSGLKRNIDCYIV